MNNFKFLRGFIKEDNFILHGLFPTISRIFANTIGMDLVSVQPMNLPTGLLTYLDFRYENEETWRISSRGVSSLNNFKFLRGYE